MKYEKPIVELIELEVDDIICTSPEDEDGLAGEENGDLDNNPWG